MAILLRRIRPLVAIAAVALALPVLVGACGCQTSSAERQLTFVLVEYQGKEAVASAQRLAGELAAKGLPNVFVVEGAEFASVCAGRFDSWNDPDSDTMLKQVRPIRDAQGQYPFAGVLLMPVPEPRPVTQWTLEKAPPGYFTLHVASYEAPGRMNAAVAYAEELRSRGLEAYVYHGPRLSMVTIGSFGINIFDDPGKVGRPGAKPRIVAPKVLALIQKFPRMRLEGKETPPDAHVPTQLVKIPGRQPPSGPAVARPGTFYRVTLALLDTRTGRAEGLAQASGVAQSWAELPTLVGVLMRQIAEAGEAQGRQPRVGLAGILAADPGAAAERGDQMAIQAAEAALGAAGKGKFIISNLQTTRQLLDAAGLKADDVIRDGRQVRGFKALDYVIVGTVTSFK